VRLPLTANLLLSATFSLTAVIVFSGDELSRRLGEYVYIYLALWVVAVFGLLLLGVKAIRSYSLLKVVLLSLAVGYLSAVVAYVFAVVLDVSSVREVHKPNTADIIAISLLFPFFALRGWLFSVMFVPIAATLNYFGRSRRIG
jgi:hypothetical protein